MKFLLLVLCLALCIINFCWNILLSKKLINNSQRLPSNLEILPNKVLNKKELNEKLEKLLFKDQEWQFQDFQLVSFSDSSFIIKITGENTLENYRKNVLSLGVGGWYERFEQKVINKTPVRKYEKYSHMAINALSGSERGIFNISVYLSGLLVYQSQLFFYDYGRQILPIFDIEDDKIICDKKDINLQISNIIMNNFGMAENECKDLIDANGLYIKEVVDEH